MSLRSCSSTLRGIWVQFDEGDRGPVPRATAPTVGRRRPRLQVQLLASLKHCGLSTEVTLVRRDVANRAVSMLAVVPVDKFSDPVLGSLDVNERQLPVLPAIAAPR